VTREVTEAPRASVGRPERLSGASCAQNGPAGRQWLRARCRAARRVEALRPPNSRAGPPCSSRSPCDATNYTRHRARLFSACKLTSLTAAALAAEEAASILRCPREVREDKCGDCANREREKCLQSSFSPSRAPLPLRPRPPSPQRDPPLHPVVPVLDPAPQALPLVGRPLRLTPRGGHSRGGG
jgi:hypothetical protein